MSLAPILAVALRFTKKRCKYTSLQIIYNRYAATTLTHLALLNLLRCNSKDRKDFYHYFGHDDHHFGGRWDFYVDFKVSEKGFNMLEYIDESFLARKKPSLAA